MTYEEYMALDDEGKMASRVSMLAAVASCQDSLTEAESPADVPENLDETYVVITIDEHGVVVADTDGIRSATEVEAMVKGSLASARDEVAQAHGITIKRRSSAKIAAETGLPMKDVISVLGAIQKNG